MAIVAVAAAAMAATAGGTARAAVYLVGAQLYSCSEDGTNGGPGAYGPAYQYSTNAATSHEPLYVEGVGPPLSLLLAEGENVLDFSTSGIDPGDYACLNLFFDGVAIPYNPPYMPGAGIAGLLAAIAPLDGATFAIPARGIDVQAYNSTGSSYLATSYSGRTEIRVAGRSVEITGFTVSSTVQGSFAVTVPEPGAGPWAAGAGLALLALRRRGPRLAAC